MFIYLLIVILMIGSIQSIGSYGEYTKIPSKPSNQPFPIGLERDLDFGEVMCNCDVLCDCGLKYEKEQDNDRLHKCFITNEKANKLYSIGEKIIVIVMFSMIYLILILKS